MSLAVFDLLATGEHPVSYELLNWLSYQRITPGLITFQMMRVIRLSGGFRSLGAQSMAVLVVKSGEWIVFERCRFEHL